MDDKTRLGFMGFVKALKGKLCFSRMVNGRWSMVDDRSGLSGSLACLSVRFALKFDADGTAGDVVCTQIARHTVCDPAGDDCRAGEIRYPWRIRTPSS